MGKPPSQRNEQPIEPRRKAAPRRSKHQRRQRTLAIVGGVTLLAVLLGTVAAGFAGRSDDDGDASPTSTSSSIAAPAVALTPPPAGESITGETPCPAADGSSPRTTTFENPPPTCIDPARQYQAVIDTTKGPISVLLNTEQAPGIVNNFVVLSRYHFYDGVPFFSIVPQKYLATGDATGNPLGTGGPGYTLPDEIPEEGAIYPWGTLAMVGEEGAPDTNGSMFIIASGDDAADLPAVFSVFGQVLDGADAVKAINNVGNPSTGQPSEDVQIEKVTITEQ